MIGGMTADPGRLSFADKPTLVGKGVLLRPVGLADAEGLAELITNPEVLRLTGSLKPPGSDPLELARKWYGSRHDRDDRLDLAIVERAGGRYVGEAVLNDLDAADRSCSFRIALIGPRVFGRGYGTEATRLILSHAFGTAGVHRVSLEVFSFNPRARHVYEKAGFTHEGTQDKALYREGRWYDTHTMAVHAPDWLARHGRPAAR